MFDVPNKNMRILDFNYISSIPGTSMPRAQTYLDILVLREHIDLGFYAIWFRTPDSITNPFLCLIGGFNRPTRYLLRRTYGDQVRGKKRFAQLAPRYFVKTMHYTYVRKLLRL